MGAGCSKRRDAFTPKPLMNIGPAENDSKRTYSNDKEQQNQPVRKPENVVTCASAHALQSDKEVACKQTVPDGNVNKGTKRDTKPWIEILNEIAELDIWDGVRRESRTGWREYLEKADEILKQPRTEIPDEIVQSMLQGEFNVDGVPRSSNKVLVFVSSTFTDTKAERNLLMRDVYPFVRIVCRRLGLDFGTVDMRWGVTEEATHEHRTVKMCVDEIQRCIEQSCGPVFLGFLSHKYGYRPLPATIEKSEYDTMMAYFINNEIDTRVVKTYYQLDKNSLEPEFVLKSMDTGSDGTQWWNDVEIIQTMLREASVECFGDKNKITDKYFVSVTETEIDSGVFKNDNSSNQVIIVHRDLKDVRADIHIHRRLIDMKGKHVDELAQKQLHNLITDKLKTGFSNTKIHSTEYKSPNPDQCKQYIRDMCDHVCRTLLENIFEKYERELHVEEDEVVDELVQHNRLAIEKSALFVGRERELQRISDYLKSEDDQPLVVHGQSGIGKTALMAVAGQKVKAILQESVVILRFLGTTSQSGSARAVLLSVCKQITRAYYQDEAIVPIIYKDLVTYFKTCLSFAHEKTPLVLFLDSLDQLSEEDSGKNLHWLNLDESLPKNVKIVLSTLPGEPLVALKRKLKTEQFVGVEKLSPDEGPTIFMKMLQLKGRKVTDSQQEIIMASFKKCPLPLYLRLAADIASTWRSYDVISSTDISSDIPGLISHVFKKLETRYGKMFVHHALGYITAAKEGLTQNELEDILSCEDEVLDQLFKYWTPPFRRIPQLLWTRVRSEIGPYLVERGSGGVNAYSWYHRQFWQTAAEMYVQKNLNGEEDGSFFTKSHQAIADYFDSKYEHGKAYPDPSNSTTSVPRLENRGVPKQPFVISGDRNLGRQMNKRKLTELPYHLLALKDGTRFKKLVFNLEFIEAKFEAGFGYDCYRELIAGNALLADESLKSIVRFVGSNMSVLLREPTAVYQLASQQHPQHPARKLLTAAQFDLPVTLLKNIVESGADELCELTLQGHSKGARCCDYSSTGAFIISTGDDGALRVWDTISGAEVVTITSASFSKIAIEEEYSGMMLAAHHSNPCCFSRTGEVIATGTDSGEITLWDISGAKIKTEQTDNHTVTYVTYSPNDEIIATSFINGDVYFWNAENLEHVATVQLEQTTTCLDFSPDGSVLAISCINGLALIDVALTKDETQITSVKGTIMSFGEDKAAKQNIKKSRRASGRHMTLCCAFHPGATMVMTGGSDSQVATWDTSSGNFIDKLQGHVAWIWSIKFTKNGDTMFTASSDRAIKVWQCSDSDEKPIAWKCVSTISGHSHRVMMLALEPSSESKLVSASLDCSLKVWDVKALMSLTDKDADEADDIKQVQEKSHFNTLAISSSGEHIAVSTGWSRSCTVRRLNDEDDSAHIISVTTETHTGFIKKAEFLADDRRLVTLDHGHRGDYEAGSGLRANIYVCDVNTGERIGTLTVTDDSDQIENAPSCFCSGKQFIVVGTLTGEIILFDIATNKACKQWKWRSDVSSVACSKDHVVATSGSYCSIWRSCAPLSDLAEHDSTITTCTFSPDGDRLLTGTVSGKTLIWNISDTGVTILKTLTAHTSAIKDLHFSQNGRFIVTCGDSSVRIWDIQYGTKMKCVYFAPVTCAVFKNDFTILAGDATGVIHTLQF